MRYGERLKLDIYMDEDMEDILVPAMSVLTFVENAVKHQMKQKETLFILVWVRLQEKKDRFFFFFFTMEWDSRKKYLNSCKRERTAMWRKRGMAYL